MLTVAYLFVTWIGSKTSGTLISVGVIWLGLTVLFELGLGRLVLGYSRERLFEEYDLSKGGLLLPALAFLALSPVIAMKFHSRKKRRNEDAATGRRAAATCRLHSRQQ